MVPKDFFEALWSGGGCEEVTGFIELLRIGGNFKGIIPEYFEYPKCLSQFTERADELSGQTNLYYGVTLKPFAIDPKVHRRKDGKAAKRASEIHTKVGTAVWIDSDENFKTTIDLLKKFPLKASLGVLSGRPTGGIHAYWLLEEPAEAETELAKLKSINKALANYFNVDRHTVDLARVLRIPGTFNIKYPKHGPLPCKWNVKRGDQRYNLMDFEEFLSLEEPRLPSVGGGVPVETPGQSMPSDLSRKISDILAELWLEGYRHRLTLYISGILAHAGFSEDSCATLIRSVTALAKDEEADARLTDVRTTYEQFVNSGKVAGAPTLEKMVKEEFPEAIRPRAEKVFEIVDKSIKAQGKQGRPQKQANFRIEKLVKFDSRPAQYRVTIKTVDGESFNVQAETGTFMNFKSFKVAALEQGNAVLISSQVRWETAIAGAMTGLEVQEAPPEATFEGQMGGHLDLFLDSKREEPEPGMLRTVPGYNENEIFFSLGAFQRHMKDNGMVTTQQRMCRVLRALDWEPETRRFGGKTAKVWVKTLQESGPNGQMLLGMGEGNGQP